MSGSELGSKCHTFYHLISVRQTLFSYNSLWLASCCPTSGKNNKAVNVWSKGICILKNKMEVYPLCSMCVCRHIYFFSMTSCSSNKVASLTSVISLNMVNKLSSFTDFFFLSTRWVKVTEITIEGVCLNYLIWILICITWKHGLTKKGI